MINSNNSNGATVEAGPVVPKPSNLSLKKGPWTAAEDAILMEYVKRHGEGNWNHVQKNSGLMRCGKSCRLRWANHLRPNLKKGSFTPEEERTIIELHAKLGNKWARMASQLPGRTDNEIKNYWNTRMKRRQRAGLPIYPQEFQEKAAAFHFQQQQQQQRHNTSSPSLSSLISSVQKGTYNPSLSVFEATNFSTAPFNPLQNNISSGFCSNPTQQFKLFRGSNDNNGSLALPLSPVSPYARSHSPTTLFNPNLVVQHIQTPQPSFQYSAADVETNMNFTSLMMGAPVEAVYLVPGQKGELPSGQPPPRPTTPASNASGGVCLTEASSKNTDNDSATGPLVAEDNINSGLLDALLQESNTLARKGKLNDENPSVASDKGKRVLDESTKEEEEEKEDAAVKRVRLSSRNGIEASCENRSDDLSSFQSSIGYNGTKPSEEPVEEMNSMDDDLLSLLNNFQSSMPLPEWYHQSRIASNGSSSDVTGDARAYNVNPVADQFQQTGRLDNFQEDSSTNGVMTTDAVPNLDCALGSCYWNNMPGIC